MQVSPVGVVSIATFQYFDHLYKSHFIKEGNNVKVETEKFPLSLYNSQAQMVHSATKGEKVDIKV